MILVLLELDLTLKSMSNNSIDIDYYIKKRNIYSLEELREDYTYFYNEY